MPPFFLGIRRLVKEDVSLPLASEPSLCSPNSESSRAPSFLAIKNREPLASSIQWQKE